jgi:hypothetical protein
MDLIIRRDIRQLLCDGQKVEKGLDMLEQDHEIWARERQQYDLKQLIKHVNRLESDVSIMQSDCMSMGLSYQEVGIWQVLESLHRAFGVLNTLFNDLKKVRTELSDAYIHPTDLKQLEIDWGRFRKTIGQIQEYLHNGQNFLEQEHSLSSSEQVGNDLSMQTHLFQEKGRAL